MVCSSVAGGVLARHRCILSIEWETEVDVLGVVQKLAQNAAV